MSGIYGPQVPAEKLNFMNNKTECSTRLKTKRSILCTLFQNSLFLFCSVNLCMQESKCGCVWEKIGGWETLHTLGYTDAQRKKAVLCFKYLSLFRVLIVTAYLLCCVGEVQGNEWNTIV